MPANMNAQSYEDKEIYHSLLYWWIVSFGLINNNNYK